MEKVGCVVEYDKDQLTSAILHILEDRNVKREFGEKGRLLIRERFNWLKIAEQVEGLYLECLQGSVKSTVPRGATN